MIYFAFSKVPEPTVATKSILKVISGRISGWVSENGRVPESLQDIYKEVDMNGFFKDAWGHEIKYFFNGSTITLLSYGKDGIPGGLGENADIYYTFSPATPDNGVFSSISNQK
jgi:hypothetical protein